MPLTSHGCVAAANHALGTYQTGQGNPYLPNCTMCPTGSYQPATGASNASACIMCPVGRYPVAANASRCGNTAPGGYSTTLYAVIGSLLGAGILAAGTCILVLSRRRSTSVDQKCAGEKTELVAGYGETRLMGLLEPVKRGDSLIDFVFHLSCVFIV